MKDSVVIYKSWKPLIDSLPPDLRLEFYDILWGYDGLDYNPSISNPHLNGIFQFILSKIKDNDRKYEEKCKKAAESVRKRWERKANDGINEDTIHTNVSGGNWSNTNHTDIDSDPVNDSVIDSKENKKIPFEEFWELYGNKTGKSDAKGKWERLSLKIQKLIMADIPLYRDSLSDIKYIRHPATYLNQKGWEDERVITPKAQQPNNSPPPRMNRI